MRRLVMIGGRSSPGVGKRGVADAVDNYSAQRSEHQRAFTNGNLNRRRAIHFWYPWLPGVRAEPPAAGIAEPGLWFLRP